MQLDYDCVRLLQRIYAYDKDVFYSLTDKNLYTIHIPPDAYANRDLTKTYKKRRLYFGFPYYRNLICGTKVPISNPNVTMSCVLINCLDVCTRAYALLQDAENNERLCIIDKMDNCVTAFTPKDAQLPKSWDITRLEYAIDERIAVFLQCTKQFKLKGERYINTPVQLKQFAKDGDINKLYEASALYLQNLSL